MGKIHRMTEEIPFDFEGQRELMQEYRERVDAELAELIKRETSIEECLLSGKTRKGTPLTMRGRRKLLSELRRVHTRQAALYLQGSEVAKRRVIFRHNDESIAMLRLEGAAARSG